MDKVWVVCEINWQYNDEYYFIEEGLGPLKKGFVSKDEADTICKKLNRERFTEICNNCKHETLEDYIGSDYYGQGIEYHSPYSDTEIATMLAYANIKIVDNKYSISLESTLPDSEKFTPAQIDVLIDVFSGLKFYEVVSVDVS